MEQYQGAGNEPALEMIARQMGEIQAEMAALRKELAEAREEARQARAVISQGMGMHHDQTYFYLGQYVGAFNLLGGKLNAVAQLITGRGVPEVVPEGLIKTGPRWAPLPELRPDGSVETPAPPVLPTRGSSASAPETRRVSRRDRPRDS